MSAVSYDEAPPAPDSSVAEETHQSPNHHQRRAGRRPDMLLLHYTGMPTGADALARLCDPASEVSAHYLVFENGRVLQLVPESRRAWHAGTGSWDGETDINSCSIGIEIVYPGHEGGLPPFPEPQINAVLRLSRDILERWLIRPDRVLAHSDVAPARKEDPGEMFPWGLLHAAGVGHWVPPAPLDERPLHSAESGAAALREMLAAYGYGFAPTGTDDQATAEVVTAFQRHFRPARVDGIADASTIVTLQDLLRTRPR